MIVLVFLLLLVSMPVEAASLKICYDAASVGVDVVTIPVFADANPLYPDILADSVLTGTKRCATEPFPPSLIRGTNVAITLKAANALGEVGPASSAVTFRAPGIPAAITGVTVSAVVP